MKKEKDIVRWSFVYCSKNWGHNTIVVKTKDQAKKEVEYYKKYKVPTTKIVKVNYGKLRGR